MRTVRSSSFVQSREKKKKKKIQNSRVYPTSFDKRRSDTCSFVFGELVESPRVKYLDTNIYIYVCVKKDPRNNFPKSTFRIIENDRYSTISRWEIKRKKKIARVKKYSKLKFPNWPKITIYPVKKKLSKLSERFVSISADTEIFRNVLNCLIIVSSHRPRVHHTVHGTIETKAYAVISRFAYLDRCLERHWFPWLTFSLREKRLYFRGTRNMHARFHIVCLYHNIYIYIYWRIVYINACAVYYIRMRAGENRYDPCQNVRHRSCRGGGKKFV